MKPRTRKLLRLACISAIAAGVFVAALFLLAEPLLSTRSELRTADAVVVLGGEPVVRARAAGHLITNGLAPRVFVSGEGDCEDNRRVLERMGVRREAIVVECDSTSTQENAVNTIQLLREQKCRRVIIVTSWFHSRRALSTFRKYAPEVEFLSAPVPRTQPWRYERHYIAAEYLKTVVYLFRFGVWPSSG